MALYIYNTLTRTKEEFKPLHDKRVGMYVCGPTVYGHSHLGHAKSYVSFDVIVRYLRHRGYNVLYVQNITDVGHLLGDENEGEDRIIRQGKLEHKHPMEIAETYTRSYFEDMDALGIVRPDISPRATGHIIEQIELIQMLLKKGFAYEAGGSVYFDVKKIEGYGKLSGQVLDEQATGTRVKVKSEKRNPADFALWKRAGTEHIMRWPSPWGPGFPGWHVECSAMSMKYLGDSFDIHGGGLENQFPHHECEIAQSEGATGRSFVKYWLHNNMVTVDGQKMGKSLGNFITLKDAFTKWEPQVIRFFILQSHYRSTLDFSNDAVDAAGKGLERLTNTIRIVREKVKFAKREGTPVHIDLQQYRTAFNAAMDDDFNTPQAIAVLFELSKEVNPVLSSSPSISLASLNQIEETFGALAGGILGIRERRTARAHDVTIPLTGVEAKVSVGDVTLASDGQLEPNLIDLIVRLREEIRSQQLWSLSDKIRDALAKLGITLKDTKEGTSWKKTS